MDCPGVRRDLQGFDLPPGARRARTPSAAARTGARVHRVNAQQLETLGRRFDAVTLTDVLEHIPHPVDLLSQLRAVMTPGAWLAVKVPCGPAQHFKENV